MSESTAKRASGGHMRTILQVSGGSLADVAKVTVYRRDRGMRDLVNAEWIRLFPDEDDRPVRHTVESEFSGNRVVQIEFMAALPVGAR